MNIEGGIERQYFGVTDTTDHRLIILSVRLMRCREANLKFASFLEMRCEIIIWLLNYQQVIKGAINPSTKEMQTKKRKKERNWANSN